MGDDEQRHHLPLRITLSPDIDAQHLRRILEQDREADSVVVTLSSDLFCGHGASLFQELIEWFVLIGQVLQNLKHFQVVLRKEYDCLLSQVHLRTRGMPLRAFAEVFRQRRDTLVSVCIDIREKNIPHYATPEDFQSIVVHLGEATKLERFHLIMNKLEFQRKVWFAACLWQALNKIETMQDILVHGTGIHFSNEAFDQELVNNGIGGVFAGASDLIQLSQQQGEKPPLTLSLGSNSFAPRLLHKLFSDRNSRIATLKLKYLPGSGLNKALMEATTGLRNNTSLKKVHFWFPEQGIYDFVPCGLATAFLQSLEKNTSLESLSLAIKGGVWGDGFKLCKAINKIGAPLHKLELCLDPNAGSILERLGQMIGKNDSLVDLRICLCQGATEGGGSFRDFHSKLANALETNTRLREIALSSRAGWQAPVPLELNHQTVQFWLTLNRLGRTCVFETRKDWFEAIQAHRQDPSILFHLTLNNPSFLVPSACDAADGAKQPPAKTQKSMRAKEQSGLSGGGGGSCDQDTLMMPPTTTKQKRAMNSNPLSGSRDATGKKRKLNR